MDTPEKSRIGTPITKFEESPYSSFINNLSPINVSKPVNISQTMGSLNFTSPPSVFTSPHVSLHKESWFARRYQLEVSKPELACVNENKGETNEGIDNPSNCPSHSTDACEGLPSPAETQNEITDMLVDFPRELNYECLTSACDTDPYSGTDAEGKTETSCTVLYSEGEPSGREMINAPTDPLEGKMGKEAEEVHDWVDAADLLGFDSPNVPNMFKDILEKSVDEELHLFTSLITDHPERHNDHLKEQDLSHIKCLNSDVLLQDKEYFAQLGLGNQVSRFHEAQETTGNLSLNANFNGEDNDNLENEPTMHRGIRRRCLVFEIPGSRKNVNGGFVASSSKSRVEGAILSSNRRPTYSRPGDSESSKRILPGIGLHLNAIAAAASIDHTPVKPKNMSAETQKTKPVRPADALPSLQAGLDSLGSTAPNTSLEKDAANVENGDQIGAEGSQGSAGTVNEELSQNSPRKKRRRVESTGEDGACKRCNCKKSKCLKLYCECFAAGVYCVEPCSCQDCFNKPIHEDTVLATRKQIESRNPLAFAPKVIRTSEAGNDVGDDSNRTPASARHKRGCNCKKSSCLKKYCECYQGGVGCSINCRCEGCKNAFGRKDGSMPTGREIEIVEEVQAHEAAGEDNSSNGDEERESMSALPKTPIRSFRSGVPGPTSSKGGKPPKSVGMGVGLSSSSTLFVHPCTEGPRRSTYLRPQPKVDQKNTAALAPSGDHEMPLMLMQSPTNNSPGAGVKTLSPNSKRVSPPQHHQLDDSAGQTPGLLRSSRKLILQSIPSFPSLTPRR